jgi:hypothetical protein
MSDVDKIVALLGSEAVEKRIAAAIVLGEIRPKGAEVVTALADALDSDIAPLQRPALEALARLGAKRVVAKILPLLGARDESIRRAAVEALVSVGEDVLPAIRARMTEATPEERRALDAVLAALGGRDAFHTLLDGLAASDAEAARAAALAVRERVKAADARQRRSYLAETEKFLAAQARRGANPGAIAAGIKILGYLEDDRALPTLLGFTKAKDNAPGIRQEALIALRFLQVLTTPRQGRGRAAPREKADAGAYRSIVAALVDAAEDANRALAQTALHTLGGLDVPGDALARLEKLVVHPDVERARFVMEMLGRAKGAEAARLLVKVLATTGDKRRAEIAAASLGAARPGADGAPAEIRDDAVGPLAQWILEIGDADRAWLLRTVLRPSAKKVPQAVRQQMLATATKRLAAGDRNWEALIAVVRDADPAEAATALRELATKLRKSNPDKALTVLRLLCRSEGAGDDDRYALASAELARGAHDTRPAARAADESLRLLDALIRRGVDVGASLRKDRSLSLDDLYYVGFHFAEEGLAVGQELLKTVVERGGRAKVSKMAKSKLSLTGG